MRIQKSFIDTSDSGTLYLVATPIGNLDDMTFRAVQTLKQVDMIAAEDTRQTRKLLTHFNIHTRLVSYHEHNKKQSGPELIRLLQEGKDIALVSDAGMPAISDPGKELVSDAVQEGIPVVPVPGANAALSGLVASGLPVQPFLFIGFLPRDNKELKQELERLKPYPETIVIYESPHRIKKTLRHLHEAWGNREVVVARELTKKYEEFVRGDISEIRTYFEELSKIRGEFCLIIRGNSQADEEAVYNGDWWKEMTPVDHVNHYVDEGDTVKDAIKKTARDRGVSKREIYNLYHT
ncbi:MAG: 16S rRNA (cytidine(1402)-2'-O)-methyltransferase [Bacillaceae bacterium]|nr:16S rRNA (cytidine(1402)-2'-O)-methyltransferase [Bacillaceae bacterium]